MLAKRLGRSSNLLKEYFVSRTLDITFDVKEFVCEVENLGVCCKNGKAEM